MTAKNWQLRKDNIDRMWKAYDSMCLIAYTYYEHKGNKDIENLVWDKAWNFRYNIILNIWKQWQERLQRHVRIKSAENQKNNLKEKDYEIFVRYILYKGRKNENCMDR